MVTALVVPLEQHVIYLHVAVIREAEVAYAAFLALLYEPVEYAVVHITVIELGKRVVAHAYAVKQKVVDVVNLKLFQRVLEHLYRAFARLGFGREV